MSLMIIALAFIIGFLLGGLICYILLTKFTNKNSLIDELTKLKRDAAIRHRIINEFFSNAENQFLVLDRAYKSYAKFMQNSSKRFSQTDTDDIFYDLSNLDSLDSKKKSFIEENNDDIEVNVKDLRKNTIVNDIKEKEEQDVLDDKDNLDNKDNLVKEEELEKEKEDIKQEIETTTSFEKEELDTSLKEEEDKTILEKKEEVKKVQSEI